METTIGLGYEEIGGTTRYSSKVVFPPGFSFLKRIKENTKV